MKYTFESVEQCNMCGESALRSTPLGKRMNQSQGLRPGRKLGITTTVVKCRKCHLIYANPLPIPENISQHYGTPPESYWQPSYFDVDLAYFTQQIDTFLSLYNEDTQLRALDIGAGIGKCMIALGNAGFDTYGLEPARPFYQRALEKMNISPDRLQCALIEEASYPERCFDFITYGAVLEHLYDPSSAILKAIQWLKPGGLIYIEVPSSAWLTSKIYNLIYRMQGLDYVGNLSPMHAPFHLYEFGLKSFQEHARRYGYEIALHHFWVAPTHLPRVLNPILRPLMAKTDTGMQLEVWLRKPASA